MKKLDVNTFILLIIIFFLSIFSFILLVGYLLNEASKSKDLQGFQVAISFLGIFATFGGAYLGAKISGDNARKLEDIKYKQNISKTIDSAKILINMNLDYITHIHTFITEYYFIDRKKFLINLIAERENLYEDNYKPKQTDEGKLKTIEFINSYMSTVPEKKSSTKDLHKEINEIDNLIKKLDTKLIYFSKRELNTIFQLKQVLQILNNYICNSKRNLYILPKSGQELEDMKGYFMLFSILYIDLAQKVLEIDIKNSTKNSDYKIKDL
ncbi:hypothetical protein [Staphylococcus hominis]